MLTQDASTFAPIDASNIEAKMAQFCERMQTVYGSLPFAQKNWGTSILGTLVGLVCAQTCRNSWSSIGYSNICATCNDPTIRIPSRHCHVATR